MTIEPGGRRRRRELERARELAAEVAGGRVPTDRSTATAPDTAAGTAAGTAASTAAAGLAATGVTGSASPDAAGSSGVPRQAGPVSGVPQQASHAGLEAGAAAPADRPLSRRELRERDRRRAAEAGEPTAVDRAPSAPPDQHPEQHPGPHGRRSASRVPEQRSGAGPAAAPADRAVAAWPAVTEPSGPTSDPAGAESVPGAVADPQDDEHRDAAAEGDLGPVEHHRRYTAKHYLALTAVAIVLGFLIWSLATSTSGPGAESAVTAAPTTPPSATPATLRGEL